MRIRLVQAVLAAVLATGGGILFVQGVLFSQREVADERDCAVISALLQNKYSPSAATISEVRLHRRAVAGTDEQARRAQYQIDCDFSKAGIDVRDYDVKYVRKSPDDFQGSLYLGRPIYSFANKATVEVGYQDGLSPGYIDRCSLQNLATGWTLQRCDRLSVTGQRLNGN